MKLSNKILPHVIIKPYKTVFSTHEITCALCGYPKDTGISKRGYTYHQKNNKMTVLQINSYMSRHLHEKHPELEVDIIPTRFMTK